MTGRDGVVDTNELVHAYVVVDARKHEAAKRIVLPVWEEGGGCTTLQSLCEFFVVVTRKIERPMKPDRAGLIVRSIVGVEQVARD